MVQQKPPPPPQLLMLFVGDSDDSRFIPASVALSLVTSIALAGGSALLAIVCLFFKGERTTQLLLVVRESQLLFKQSQATR